MRAFIGLTTSNLFRNPENFEPVLNRCGVEGQVGNVSSRGIVNKFLKSLLKIGLDFLEQPKRASRAIRSKDDHTLRNAISFAAGIGLGIGVGMLLAPASGEETRSSIAEKVQDVGERVRGRFSPKVKKPATGTEGK
jgi:hypothetical protein